jgi:hypothetical protein
VDASKSATARAVRTQLELAAAKLGVGTSGHRCRVSEIVTAGSNDRFDHSCLPRCGARGITMSAPARRFSSCVLAVVLGIALGPVACAPLVGADFDGYRTASGAAEDAGVADDSAGILPPDVPSDRRDAGGPVCPSAGPATYPLPPPGAMTGACTPPDLDSMLADWASAKPTAQVRAAIAARNAKCEACVFTEAVDPTWGPLVAGIAPLPPSYLSINSGGCMLHRGASPACARSFYEVIRCVAVVCFGCADDAAWSKCRDDAKVANGACAAKSAAYPSACTTAKDFAALESCADRAGVVRTLCGG